MRFATSLVLMAMLCCVAIDAQTNRRRPRTMTMEATAFTRAHQETASGTRAHEGIVAADPAVLPLGTRIYISGTQGYDGSYLVTDTGSAVKGRKIDIYLPSAAAAKRFGTKRVRVQIRRLGEGKEDARRKDTGTPSGGRDQRAP